MCTGIKFCRFHVFKICVWWTQCIYYLLYHTSAVPTNLIAKFIGCNGSETSGQNNMKCAVIRYAPAKRDQPLSLGEGQRFHEASKLPLSLTSALPWLTQA